MIVVNGQVVSADQFNSQKKGLPKTFKEVREALVEEEHDEAALIFRRLWRQFPVGQPAPQRFYTPRTYRNLTLANLTWPAEEEDEVDEPEGDEDEEPAMGGFLSYDPEEPDDAPEPPNAYERIAGSDALVEEQRRFLRTVRAFELDRLQGLLEGLVQVRIEEAGGGDEGERAVLDTLLQKADAGETGRADQISLLAMLDAAPERVTGAAADALAALVRTMPPRDAAQVRRLARVLLQSGEEDVALRLYRWCALLATSSNSFGVVEEEELDVVTRVTDRELVKEARDYLEGDAKLALIQVVLDSAKPVDSPWQRETYETLVLDTWDEVVGPEEALERAGAIAEDAIDTQTGLRRRVARRVAPIYLKAGNNEDALRALEIGVAKLDPDTVSTPEERFYRVDPTRPGFISTAEWRRLFPPAGEGIPNATEWFEEVAEALESWLENERVSEDNTVQTLALLAIRLAEVDRAQGWSRARPAPCGPPRWRRRPQAGHSAVGDRCTPRLGRRRAGRRVGARIARGRAFAPRARARCRSAHYRGGRCRGRARGGVSGARDHAPRRAALQAHRCVRGCRGCGCGGGSSGEERGGPSRSRATRSVR